jgi:hypothetical protein
MPVHNESGSYFSILHGPIGFWGLPSIFAVAIIFFWLALNFVLVIGSQNTLREFKQSIPRSRTQ